MFIGGIGMLIAEKACLLDSVYEKKKIIKWLKLRIEDLSYEIQQAEENLSKFESQIDSVSNELRKE